METEEIGGLNPHLSQNNYCMTKQELEVLSSDSQNVIEGAD